MKSKEKMPNEEEGEMPNEEEERKEVPTHEKREWEEQCSRQECHKINWHRWRMRCSSSIGNLLFD
jgi:hypothetical protein